MFSKDTQVSSVENDMHTEDQTRAVELRRMPKSKRGQQRVEKILDAAAELFVQQGFEATTTNQIAAHAATSIGSLYQFFPNKETILEALAARYMADLTALVAGVAAEHPSVTTAEMFVLEADAFREYLRANPGFRAVFGASYGSEAMAATTAELNTTMVQFIQGQLQQQLPALTPERQASVAAVIMLLFDLIKLHLVEDDPALAAHNDQIYAEVQAMARVYLDSLM